MSRYIFELAPAAAYAWPPLGRRPSRKTVADTTGYANVCIFGVLHLPMPEAEAPRAHSVDYLRFPHRVTIQRNSAGDLATCSQYDL